MSISRPHSGRAALLLVDRDAFGQPARHALIRHLQRDDVRQLVPQRRFPLELAGRPRVAANPSSTTRPKQAPSAPIMPGRPSVAHGEVVVLREDLDEDRPLRRELVSRRQRLRAPGARAASRTPAAPALRPCCMRTTRSPSRTVDELVERVHHLEQVVGDACRTDRRLNEASSAVRAPGSSPVRSRCMPRSAESRGVRADRAPARGASAPPLRRTDSCARPARRRRGTPRRSAARSPAPWRLRLRTRSGLSSTYASAASSACASRLDGFTASAFCKRLRALRRDGRRRSPAAR